MKGPKNMGGGQRCWQPMFLLTYSIFTYTNIYLLSRLMYKGLNSSVFPFGVSHTSRHAFSFWKSCHIFIPIIHLCLVLFVLFLNYVYRYGNEFVRAESCIIKRDWVDKFKSKSSSIISLKVFIHKNGYFIFAATSIFC